MSDAWIEKLAIRRSASLGWRERFWREWCFLLVLWRMVRWRVLIIAIVLIGGAAMFRAFEPGRHTYTHALYCVWSLVFGEPPEEFPQHRALQVLFFVVPILGVILILETIVEFVLTLRDRKRQERSWCKTMTHAMDKHIVLIGLGRLGYRTFLLLRRLGEQVAVIERNPNNEFVEDVRREGSPVFIGDGKREEVLLEANIANAAAIILATTDDLANLEAAMDARKYNPNIRVVLRMFDPRMAEKVRTGFNIKVALSQSAISAPLFATAALEADLAASAIVDDELLLTQRWAVKAGGPLAGKTVGEAIEAYSVGVTEHRPVGGAKRLFPPPRTPLQAGDEVLLQGTFDTLGKLRAAAAASA